MAQAKEMLFQLYDATSDTLIRTIYAGEIEKFLRERLKDEKDLTRFFEQDYRVGEEQVLKDIPGVVLADMGLQAAMVLLNMIKGVIAQRSDGFRVLGGIGRTLVNRLTAPVTFLYLLVRMLRMSGRPGAFVHGGLFFASKRSG